MSFDFPAGLERDIERYAHAERISPKEAVVKLVQDALQAHQGNPTASELTAAERQSLQEADPGFAFFAKIPDSVIDNIAEASRQTRAERSTPRA